MLPIYICENDVIQLKQLESIINNFIIMNDFCIEIKGTFTSATDLLNSLSRQQNFSIYILDIGLNEEDKMNGIELASKIRKFDSRGFIIFVTAFSHMQNATFLYHTEALDYIEKITDYSTFTQRLCHDVEYAYDQYLANGKAGNPPLVVKVQDKSISIDDTEIVFIEASDRKHRVLIHTFTQLIDFNSTLSAIMPSFQKGFFQCHKSFFVNLEYIKAIDKATYTVYFKNNESCPVSMRLYNALQRNWKTHLNGKKNEKTSKS